MNRACLLGYPGGELRYVHQDDGRSGMAISVLHTAAGTLLNAAELRLLKRLLNEVGHISVLVPSFEARDVVRTALAQDDLLLGIDVITPSQWLDELWELFGDGRGVISSFERTLAMHATINTFSEDNLAPLRNNAGTIRLLEQIARELLPYVPTSIERSSAYDARAVVTQIMHAYQHILDAHDLMERSQVAVLLAELFGHKPVPPRARVLVLRDISNLPAYVITLLKVLSQKANVYVLLGAGEESLGQKLEVTFGTQEVSVALLDDVQSKVSVAKQDAYVQDTVHFLEVAGPHARGAAYADALLELMQKNTEQSENMDAPRPIGLVSAHPAQTASELAPYLVARGISLDATRFVSFGESEAGRQLIRLRNLIVRLEADEAGVGSPSEWWPAPELTDWLYSPLSGVSSADARAFDKKIRRDRSVTPQDVDRLLQSVQSRVQTRRKKAQEDNPYTTVPVVAADVFLALRQHKPVRALKAIQAVAAALPVQAWSSIDGRLSLTCEQAMIDKMLQALEISARAWNIDQEMTLDALQDMHIAMQVQWSSTTTSRSVHIMRLDEAASVAPATFDALFFADVDTDHYRLNEEEGSLVELVRAWGAPSVHLGEPELQQVQVVRALAATKHAVFARVTHDRQAKECYPAAMWTMLYHNGASLKQVGEEDVVAQFDVHGGAGMKTARVSCMPPQELSAQARQYVELKQLDPNHPGILQPRMFSASQIEAYASCPLCWFISSRVRPQTLDAGFSNLEKGNFVHDVLFCFYDRRIKNGEGRIVHENLDAALAELGQAYKDVRAEHARGKTSSSAPLIAHNAVERQQIDDILPQLEGAIRYEAEVHLPFDPMYLEYSFNNLHPIYAGRPLGGRIDRVDIDVNKRALIIDYKHRGSVRDYILKDPTVPNKEGKRASDDPRWLPEHTQSLIYAQVLRREMGLDVRGALYFATKYDPQMRGAVSAEFVEEERGAGPIPGLRDGFPAPDGSMTFDELLDRVEATIAERLDELEAGVVRAVDTPTIRCSYNHPSGFVRRDTRYGC